MASRPPVGKAQPQMPTTGRRLFQGVRDPRRKQRTRAGDTTQTSERSSVPVGAAIVAAKAQRRHRGSRGGRKREGPEGRTQGSKRPRSPERPPEAKGRGKGPKAPKKLPIGRAAPAEDGEVEVDIAFDTRAEIDDQQVFTGVIKNISPVKGLGFIVCRESEVVFGRDVIVSRENLEHFGVGDQVNFQVFVEDGKPFGYALEGSGAPPVGAPVDTSTAKPNSPERPPRQKLAPKPSLASAASSAPRIMHAPSKKVRVPIGATAPEDPGSQGRVSNAQAQEAGGTEGAPPRKKAPRYTPPTPKAVSSSAPPPAPAKPFTAFGSSPAAKAEVPKAPPPEEPAPRSFQELFEKAKSQMKQLEAKRAGADRRASEAVAPPALKATSPAPKASSPSPAAKGRLVLPPRPRGAPKLLAKPPPAPPEATVKEELEQEPEVDLGQPKAPSSAVPPPRAQMQQGWELATRPPAASFIPQEKDMGQPKVPAPPPPAPPPQAPAASSLSRIRAVAEALPMPAGEEVLLLDVVPSSALLVESLRDSILARPGIRHLNFAQPAGYSMAPWRAEVVGSPGALEEVEIFLENTLEHGSVTLAGYEAGPGSSTKVPEGSCCVAVQGFQDAFGQGGSFAALMACGRVLQWTRAGNVAYCWLASPEAVWIAQQFLHRPPSFILPDEAAQRAVKRWREGRRQEFAQLQGGLRHLPEDEELDRLLREDPTVKAAKARLAEFFRLLAEDDGYDVPGAVPETMRSNARLGNHGQQQEGYSSWQSA